jgi:class 3 adenylate cyclase
MRVARCFAFLDLSGFSAYTETHGDDQAVVVLAQLRTVLRTATERRGVRLTKWLGDGAMLSGHDAGAVIACALEARHRLSEGCPLPLRGGICRGKVIMFEGDDYVGAAVNVAAQLCEAADAGQLLAANVDDAVPSWAEVRPLEAMSFPGLSQPIAIAELALRRNPAGRILVDPVCGLPLDPDAVDAAFCSPACESSWAAAPG